MRKQILASTNSGSVYATDPSATQVENYAGKMDALLRNRASARHESHLVLIVEDDPETRRFYSSLFSEAGFATEEAHNGFQALEKASVSHPDLIVTDIAVPGLDGIELCRRLRSDSQTSNIKVLAVTAYGDRQYPDRALQAGADLVLIKPLHPDVLLNEARRLLEPAAALKSPPR